MKLTPEERLLKKPQLVFKWLKEGKIEFVDLIGAYVAYLKEVNTKRRETIVGLAIPLIQYWENPKIKPKRQERFIRAKAAYHLLRSKVFKTAEIEKDLMACVKEAGYSEDEGHHKMKPKEK